MRIKVSGSAVDEFVRTHTLVHPALIVRPDKSLVAVALERDQQQSTRRVAPGIAKAVIERFEANDVRSGRVPRQPANKTKIPERLTTLFIQADQSMYGVPPQELLSEMHSQLDLLHLPSAFRVHPALKGLW